MDRGTRVAIVLATLFITCMSIWVSLIMITKPSENDVKCYEKLPSYITE